MPGLKINSSNRGPFDLDVAGWTFGFITVMDFNYEHPVSGIMWLCRCSCGREMYVPESKIREGRHCGCYAKEEWADFYYPYSMFIRHPLFKRLRNIFNGMKKRCHNPKDTGYKWYGAKGVAVCEEWRQEQDRFYTWALANGYAPDLSIDRKDNYKGYEPSNLRWATTAENNMNKRIHQDRREGRLPS